MNIRIIKNSNKKHNKILSKESSSTQKENPKKKLLKALNNINDEINVKIDSKDNLVNNNLNLDCFINKQSSFSSPGAKSPAKFTNTQKNKKNDKASTKNNKNDSKHFIKTEDTNDKRNLRKINKIDKNDINLNIKTDSNRYKKYINSSKNSKSNIIENNHNDEKNKNIIPNIIYMNKPNNENNIKNTDIIDINKKIILYNLTKDDKFLLKDMEAQKAFFITDISSLNKKNIVNYNISLSNFNLNKILDYYSFLVDEIGKEQEKLNNVEREVSGLKENYLRMKKNEMKNSEQKNNELIIEDYKNSMINIEKLSPLSRYKTDLNFFENLIIKMNDEIKNV